MEFFATDRSFWRGAKSFLWTFATWALLALGPQRITRDWAVATGADLTPEPSSDPAGGDSPAVFPRSPILIFPGEQRILRLPDVQSVHHALDHPLQLIRLSSEVYLLRYNTIGRRTSGPSPVRVEIPVKRRLPGQELVLDALEVWLLPSSEKDAGGFRSTAFEKNRAQLALVGLKNSQIESLVQGDLVLLRGLIRSMADAIHLARFFPCLTEPDSPLPPAPPAEGPAPLRGCQGIQNDLSFDSELLDRSSQKLMQAIRSWEERQKKAGMELSQVEIDITSGIPKLVGIHPNSKARQSLHSWLTQAFPYFLDETSPQGQTSPSVYFRVLILETESSDQWEMGLHSLSPTTDATLALLPQWASPFRLALNPWELKLLHYSTRQNAEVLSAPEISMLAPGESEVFSGGEIPIKVRTRTLQQVQWKPVGLSLKIKTHWVRGSEVRFDVISEVSSVEAETSLEGIPGLSTTRLKTEVTSYFGRGTVLTGLTRKERRDSGRGIPWLKEIPLLGWAFGETDQHTRKKELVLSVIAHTGEIRAPQLTQRSAFPKGPLPLRMLECDGLASTREPVGLTEELCRQSKAVKP